MAYLYPWGNTQELNLDWIIQKIKDLENGGGSGADIEEIANVLVALTYRSANTYQRYDYAFYNGKLYRAIANTTGVFNPSDWLETPIGNDVAMLSRLVDDLDTDDVDNASNVAGATASDALNNLYGAIKDKVANLSTGTVIPANSNLNTYTTVGNYYVATIADATTILNIPAQTAGRLIVMSGVVESTTEYRKQIFLPYAAGEIYVRNTTNSGSVWSDWSALYESHGTWTPSIPRIGITQIVNNKWEMAGRLIHASAEIHMSGSGSATGNLYLDQSSLPYYSKIATAPSGTFYWSSDAKIHCCGAAPGNNNVWLADNAVVLNSTNAQNTTIVICLTYILN